MSAHERASLVVDPAVGASPLPPVITGVGAPAIAVAVAHGLNDAYAGFLHPLLPRIMDKLGLSITLAASLGMTLALAASLMQPVMGYVSDRYGRRLFVILGPVCTAVFLSLIGVAPNFGVLVCLLALGGLGSAAFHPPGAALASGASHGRGSGARFSLFSFGGSVGYALGPLLAVGMVSAFGLENLWLGMFPVLLFVIPLWLVLPPDTARSKTSQRTGSMRVLARLTGPLGLLFGVSAASTFVQRAFLTLQPIAVNAAGGTEALGALTLSIYLGGQAVGTLVGGLLSDRMDRRLLLVGLCILSLPAHVVAIALPIGSVAALAAAGLAGLLFLAMFPAIVVMAQEQLPGGIGVSSGIVMGLAWAAAAVAGLGAGGLGDMLGPRTAALLCTPVFLLAAALAAHPSLKTRTTQR